MGHVMGRAPSRTSATGYKAPARCQSCGIKLIEDKKGGGSNADGSKSAIYCSHCYTGGHFVQPDLTVAEMRQQARERLQTLGYPRIVAAILTLDIARLGRWRNRA